MEKYPNGVNMKQWKKKNLWTYFEQLFQTERGYTL